MSEEKVVGRRKRSQVLLVSKPLWVRITQQEARLGSSLTRLGTNTQWILYLEVALLLYRCVRLQLSITELGVSRLTVNLSASSDPTLGADLNPALEDVVPNFPTHKHLFLDVLSAIPTQPKGPGRFNIRLTLGRSPDSARPRRSFGSCPLHLCWTRCIPS
jgi:hypothetical protein